MVGLTAWGSDRYITDVAPAWQVVDYKEKRKWKFMQKYWHKGAYYQTGADDQFQEKDTDGIFGRDFSAPTGEDKFDKTILPKVMQVCNERSGQHALAVIPAGQTRLSVCVNSSCATLLPCRRHHEQAAPRS